MQYFDTSETKKSHQITSYQLEAGIHRGFRENQLIRGQNNYTHYSYSQYIIFVKEFIVKYNRKPYKKDLIQIINAIKSRFGHKIKVPEKNDKINVYHLWFDSNYQRFRDFILALNID